MSKWMMILFGVLLVSMTALIAGVGTSKSGKSDLLDALVKIARDSGQTVYSICVIEDGVSYSAEVDLANRCQNSYSVSKAFTVTAIGLLEDRGLLDTEDLVYPIFQDQFPEGYDKKWEKVKISDVMKHQMGIKNGFLDIDADLWTNWGSEDFLYLVFSHPLEYEPGTKEIYSDAAFYLISRIVTAKCGEKLDDFLIRELLNPMDFSEYAFSKCPYGYPMGATGMYLSSADMAKLGLLYVQKGVYNGKRLLSERYVNKVLDREFEFHHVGPTEYGYFKGGMNGQGLYFNVKTGRVVAFHTFNGPRDEIMDYVYEYDK